MYLERFITCRKDTDATYVAFACKLKRSVRLLLRKVTTFDELCELLVCDRVQSSLNENCLRYVLSIGLESTRDPNWLDIHALTEALDGVIIIS